MSSRITCAHCNTEFTPEAGVALDPCPVCGRTVEANPAPLPVAPCSICGKAGNATLINVGGQEWMHGHCAMSELKELREPTPAPLPEDVKEAVARLKVSVQNVVMGGWKQAMPDLDTLLRSLSDLTRRLAEVEAEAAGLHEEVSQRVKAASRAELHEDRAKARVRELEAEVATERAKREVMESASESYRNIAIEFSDDFRDAAMKEKLFKVDRRHARAFLNIDQAALAATEVPHADA